MRSEVRIFLGPPFFFEASSASADIRPLGYPRISSGAQSRLPPLAVGVKLTWELDAVTNPKGWQGRAAAAPYRAKAKATDVAARRLRLNK
ncbi:MAG: hypothetical protein COA41_09720 [Sphingopyxis sp.]|nr:MAG: hypothetical protein COA41_09720 [Sphingopyxis sp.]